MRKYLLIVSSVFSLSACGIFPASYEYDAQKDDPTVTFVTDSDYAVEGYINRASYKNGLCGEVRIVGGDKGVFVKPEDKNKKTSRTQIIRIPANEKILIGATGQIQHPNYITVCRAKPFILTPEKGKNYLVNYSEFENGYSCHITITNKDNPKASIRAIPAYLVCPTVHEAREKQKKAEMQNPNYKSRS